jgi:hypothetical protein
LHYKQSKDEEKSDSLVFSSNIDDLKKMLWWKFHLVNHSKKNLKRE